VCKKKVWQEYFCQSPILFFVEGVDYWVLDFLDSFEALGEFQQNNEPKDTGIAQEIYDKDDKVGKIHGHAFLHIVFEDGLNGVDLFSIDHFNKNHAWEELEDEAAEWEELEGLDDVIFFDLRKGYIGGIDEDTDQNGEYDHSGDEFFEPVVDFYSLLVEEVVVLCLVVGLELDGFGVDVVKF